MTRCRPIDSVMTASASPLACSFGPVCWPSPRPILANLPHVTLSGLPRTRIDPRVFTRDLACLTGQGRDTATVRPRNRRGICRGFYQLKSMTYPVPRRRDGKNLTHVCVCVCARAPARSHEGKPLSRRRGVALSLMVLIYIDKRRNGCRDTWVFSRRGLVKPLKSCEKGEI